MSKLIELFEHLDPGPENRRGILRRLYTIWINLWTEDNFYKTIIEVLDSEDSHRRGELFGDMSDFVQEEIVRRCIETDADWARTMDAHVNACIVTEFIRNLSY